MADGARARTYSRGHAKRHTYGEAKRHTQQADADRRPEHSLAVKRHGCREHLGGEDSERNSALPRVASAHTSTMSAVDAHMASMRNADARSAWGLRLVGGFSTASDEPSSVRRRGRVSRADCPAVRWVMTFPSIALPMSGSTGVISAQPTRFRVPCATLSACLWSWPGHPVSRFTLAKGHDNMACRAHTVP